MRRSVLVLVLIVMAKPAHAWCWTAAAARYHVDPLLLYAIAKVESGLNPRATGWNRNGSHDIGLMQINSSHLHELAAFGVTEQRLRAEPCTSIMSGAWILARFVHEFGYGWAAVGAYNAGSDPQREALRQQYARRVWAYYRLLVRWRARAGKASAGVQAAP